MSTKLKRLDWKPLEKVAVDTMQSRVSRAHNDIAVFADSSASRHRERINAKRSVGCQPVSTNVTFDDDDNDP